MQRLRTLRGSGERSVARGALLALAALAALAVAARPAPARDVPFSEDLRIEIVAGDGQAGDSAAPPAQPLVVRVYDEEYDRPSRAGVPVSFVVVRGTCRVARHEESGANPYGAGEPNRAGRAGARVTFGDLPEDGPAREEVVVRATIGAPPGRSVEFHLANNRRAGGAARIAEPWRGVDLRLPVARVLQGTPCLVTIAAPAGEEVRIRAPAERLDVLPEAERRADAQGRCRFIVIPRRAGPVEFSVEASSTEDDPENRVVQWIVDPRPDAPSEGRTVPPAGPATAPRIEVVAGNFQRGEVENELAHPFELRLLGADGTPVAGAKLRLESTITGGRLDPPEPTTDGAGRATVRYTFSQVEDLDVVTVALDQADSASAARAGGRPAATPVVVLTGRIRFVTPPAAGASEFEVAQGISDLDFTLDFEREEHSPGTSISGGDPEIFIELLTRDYGPTVTVSLSLETEDGTAVASEKADALVPARQVITLTAVRREPTHTLYRSAPLYATSEPDGPRSLTPEERRELKATGMFRGHLLFRSCYNAPVHLHGPLEAERGK
ncbi:MAG: hypothetical protein HZA54_02675 [Planctomycetes bacterium]|nr:hypothetical protein [Planctomycetota bacterium]